MTSREFDELVAMNMIEPVGFDRLDWYACQLLAAWTDKKAETFHLGSRRQLFEGEDDFDIEADMRAIGAI